MSLTPANPKMDPVKTVRIAITDGINLMEPEILELRNAVSVENVEAAVAEEAHEVVVAVPEAVVALEGSVTSTGSLATTRRK